MPKATISGTETKSLEAPEVVMATLSTDEAGLAVILDESGAYRIYIGTNSPNQTIVGHGTLLMSGNLKQEV